MRRLWWPLPTGCGELTGRSAGTFTLSRSRQVVPPTTEPADDWPQEYLGG